MVPPAPPRPPSPLRVCLERPVWPLVPSSSRELLSPLLPRSGLRPGPGHRGSTAGSSEGRSLSEQVLTGTRARACAPASPSSSLLGVLPAFSKIVIYTRAKLPSAITRLARAGRLSRVQSPWASNLSQGLGSRRGSRGSPPSPRMLGPRGKRAPAPGNCLQGCFAPTFSPERLQGEESGLLPISQVRKPRLRGHVIGLQQLKPQALWGKWAGAELHSGGQAPGPRGQLRRLVLPVGLLRPVIRAQR